MSLTVDEFRARLLQEYPTRDWDQQCARLCWNAVWLTTGVAESKMVTYPSAIAAYRESKIVSTDPETAPLGAIHHWSVGKFGHDGVSLGHGMMLHTSNHATNVDIWGKHLFVAEASSYSLGTYLGWSLTFGRNVPVALTEPVLAPNERRVKATAFTNKRLAPSTLGEIRGVYPAGVLVAFTGFVHGENVNGNDVWFTDTSFFAWSGGFTSTSTEGLTDMTPTPEPTPKPSPDPAPPPVNRYGLAAGITAIILATLATGITKLLGMW